LAQIESQHTAPVPQAMPQPPQFSASLDVSTHAMPQRICVPAPTHTDMSIGVPVVCRAHAAAHRSDPVHKASRAALMSHR
jgi:hypothetical protein